MVDTKSVDDAEREALFDAAEFLDHTCNSIFIILLEDKSLRFGHLKNSVTKMTGTDISNKVLSKHLKHLEEKKLVKRIETGFQEVSYALSDKCRSIMITPKEAILEYLELGKSACLPPELREIPLTSEDFYGNLSDDQVDLETDRDLHDIMALNLWEARASIDNGLQLKDGDEDDESFWKYVIRPIYRLTLERAMEKCRYNDNYRKALFDKIELLTDALRSDRELYRKRRITGKRVRK
ncbi:MAG: hypothetical protein GX660_29200 [Clostridiaceae bacterium]|nr:hypothetical protein [Clostridiaceae bacterium]